MRAVMAGEEPAAYDATTFVCEVCGAPVERGPGFCSAQCLRTATRELHHNAEQHQRLSRTRRRDGDNSEALYRLALRNGRLMAAIQSWRPRRDN